MPVFSSSSVKRRCETSGRLNCPPTHAQLAPISPVLMKKVQLSIPYFFRIPMRRRSCVMPSSKLSVKYFRGVPSRTMPLSVPATGASVSVSVAASVSGSVADSGAGAVPVTGSASDSVTAPESGSVAVSVGAMVGVSPAGVQAPSAGSRHSAAARISMKARRFMIVSLFPVLRIDLWGIRQIFRRSACRIPAPPRQVPGQRRRAG